MYHIEAAATQSSLSRTGHCSVFILERSRILSSKSWNWRCLVSGPVLGVAESEHSSNLCVIKKDNSASTCWSQFSIYPFFYSFVIVFAWAELMTNYGQKLPIQTCLYMIYTELFMGWPIRWVHNQQTKTHKKKHFLHLSGFKKMCCWLCVCRFCECNDFWPPVSYLISTGRINRDSLLFPSYLHVFKQPEHKASKAWHVETDCGMLHV